ncbi:MULTISPECIES: TerD family protein [Gammaproteobacteria]|jgi:tellurium resistance protein TerD|uniref:TerD family protein n=1 Tax=Gammaproteobacteria TaxID=1236 RepID=UPI0002CE5710|nr:MULTISPECIES: TerD family protein [Acinetobacter]HAV4232237.1 chemical-damaging agent resistance protein C [Acinetobacter baumannii ATCC 17978]EJB8480617.1 TerD family protein [Acinetobacter baumannii]EKU3409977.1 TerD family protein [Acinetobacter baumannii]EKV4527193.1 TerD family protein [Acinetobacter baumannii]EMC1587599.1 TerD family protein [Acinetobacter baumannii]
MAISLTKGGNVSLTKEAPGITKTTVGLGWNPRVTDGTAFDLDAIAFLVNENGKVRADNDFIFFNNLKSSDGSVVHNGDNRTGEGDGDDETLSVDLSKVPADVSKVIFAVTIYDGQARNQNFGQVANAYIRVTNDAGGSEIARYDLSEDSSTETAMIFGELYKHGSEWKFRAIGQGFAGGLGPLAASYGVSV